MGAATLRAPEIHEHHVTFHLADQDRALASVKLIQELARPRVGPDFVRFATTDDWVATFPRADVARMEYQFHLVHEDGATETIPDPGNPLRAGGPFGEKSVIEFADYERPRWLDADAPEGRTDEISIRSRALRANIPAAIWAPEGHEPDEPLPLLIAHDGPEYAMYSSLTKLLQVAVHEGRLPPMRAALVQPLNRNETYSASARYSRALTYDVIPELGRLAPSPAGRTARVGMGASLGALAMLHAHRNNPASFAALFLQSGSFFRQRFDKSETGFERFGRISRFVGRVLSATEWPFPIPVTLTCGNSEENLFNNRAVTESLVAQGYDVTFAEHRDAHNWVSWRDIFDPHLIDLLAKVWG